MPETPPEAAAAGGSGTAPGTLGVGAPVVLACYDVTKSYGGVLAVDSVTLEIPARGLFGLCGFNGGKPRGQGSDQRDRGRRLHG